MDNTTLLLSGGAQSSLQASPS